MLRVTAACASETESDRHRFKNERNYRIPVKSDPSIVIKHIKESHLILKQNLGELGALSIGGAQRGSTRRRACIHRALPAI